MYAKNKTIAKKLRDLRNGAVATGAGSIFGFFSSNMNYIFAASQVAMTLPALKSTWDGEGEAMVYNIVGGGVTNFLTILLHYYGPGLSGPVALAAAATITGICAEGLAMYLEEENSFRNRYA